MLTRAGYAMLAAALILLVSGIPTGNLFIVTLALFPLAFFIVSALGAKEPRVEAARHLPERTPRVGDTFEIRVDYTVHGGTGLVEIHQPIPAVFSLESGSNIAVTTKGNGPARGALRFEVRAPRRGNFTIQPLDWELVPPLGFASPTSGKAGEPVDLEIRPGLIAARRMLSVTAKATTLFPDNDESKVGVQTTDFRDIRDYVRGDPPRTINWKATARVMARHHGAPGPQRTAGNKGLPNDLVPLVNEYEREGKKSVWLFVDCGPHMRVGTTAQNLFEVAVDAAQGTAAFFLDRGYRVGMTLFDREDPLHLYPDVGRRQLFRIREELAVAEPSTVRGDLPYAVTQVKRFLLMSRGLAIVITRADAADGTLIAGLRKLRALVARRRRRIPILVLSPEAYGLIPDEHAGTEGARQIQRWLDQGNVDKVRKLGIEVLTWDPDATNFQTVLARRVGAR